MAFDPRQHLIKLQGKDYLEARWRLAWLRDEHPDATIETELVAFDVAQEWCIVKATVTIPGRGAATGMALQKPTGIAKDYVANGETSAIGRALGALGYGTQFAIEFDQGEQVVDSPVKSDNGEAAARAVVDESRVYAPVAQKGVPPSAESLGKFWEAADTVGWKDRAAVEAACADISGGLAVRQLSAAGLRELYRELQSGRLQRGPDGRFAVQTPPPAPVGAAT